MEFRYSEYTHILYVYTSTCIHVPTLQALAICETDQQCTSNSEPQLSQCVLWHSDKFRLLAIQTERLICIGCCLSICAAVSCCQHGYRCCRHRQPQHHFACVTLTQTNFKLSLQHVMRAQTCTSVLSFNSDTCYGWVVEATPRQLYPWEADMASILHDANWAPRLVWTCVQERKLFVAPGSNPKPSSLYRVTLPTMSSGPPFIAD